MIENRIITALVALIGVPLVLVGYVVLGERLVSVLPVTARPRARPWIWVGPALASLAIFQFMWVWNDLLVALIYLGGTPSVAPMTVTIGNLVNSLGGGWQLLTAAAFISMLLPLLVFFTLQRYFVSGLLAGSVKG